MCQLRVSVRCLHEPCVPHQYCSPPQHPRVAAGLWPSREPGLPATALHFYCVSQGPSINELVWRCQGSTAAAPNRNGGGPPWCGTNELERQNDVILANSFWEEREKIEKKELPQGPRVLLYSLSTTGTILLTAPCLTVILVLYY